MNDSEEHGAPKEAMRRKSSLKGSETNICCSGFPTLVALEPPEGSFKHGLLASTSRASDSRNQGLNGGICLSNKFPGNANAARPGAILCKPDTVLGILSHLIFTTG